MAWTGEDRRKSDSGDNKHRRSEDLAKIIGKVDNQLNSFSKELENVKDVVRSEVGAMKEILDVNMDMVEGKINNLEDKLDDDIEQLKEDHVQYRQYVQSQVEIHTSSNNKDHSNLQSGIIGTRKDLHQRVDRLESRVAHQSDRIEELERIPGKEAQKKIKNFSDIFFRIIIPIISALLLAWIALKIGLPV
jgi:tetrahydromethanopterin S-methyltransferase subunit B